MTLYRIQSEPDDGPILYLAASGILTEDADKALGWIVIENAEEVLAASSICRAHAKEFCVNAFNESPPEESDEPTAETEADWAKEDAAVNAAQEAEAGAAEGTGAPEPEEAKVGDQGEGESNPDYEPMEPAPPGPEPDSQPDIPEETEPEPETEPDAKEPEPGVTPTGSGAASG